MQESRTAHSQRFATQLQRLLATGVFGEDGDVNVGRMVGAYLAGVCGQHATAWRRRCWRMRCRGTVPGHTLLIPSVPTGADMSPSHTGMPCQCFLGHYP